MQVQIKRPHDFAWKCANESSIKWTLTALIRRLTGRSSGSRAADLVELVLVGKVAAKAKEKSFIWSKKR